jgi:hypothetical protein
LAATASNAGSPSPGSVPCCSGATIYTWQNQHSALYLHVQGDSTANSAAVNVYERTGTCANHGATNTNCAEEWQVLDTGHGNEFAYANVNSGLCLSDPNDAENVGAIQYSCGAYPVQRRWTYDYSSPGGPFFYPGLYDETASGQLGFLCQDAGSADPEPVRVMSTGGNTPGALGWPCTWQ